MPPAQQNSADEPSNESNELIARRLRVGLGVILAGIVLSMLGDHALMSDRPRWADLMDSFAIVLVAAGFWASGGSVIRRRPVPFALLTVALACAMSAAAGIWFADLAQKAILCVAIALTAGATLPWGVRPRSPPSPSPARRSRQCVSRSPPCQRSIAAFRHRRSSRCSSSRARLELQRYRAHLAAENVQRKRAEEALARMNTDLERLRR
jgi:hypothetical protein